MHIVIKQRIPVEGGYSAVDFEHTNGIKVEDYEDHYAVYTTHPTVYLYRKESVIKIKIYDEI